MSDIPTRASAVVIGAGIVGNSLVHHLALLGWKDIVLVDKGPLPNPGGSTGHASNFIFPIEYSRLMFELTGFTRRRGRPASPVPAPPSRSTRCTASCTPPNSSCRCARCAPARSTGGPAILAPSSTRPHAGSGRTGTRQTSRCSRSTRAGSWSVPPSGSPAGGRRLSTPSTWRCGTGPGSSTCPRSPSLTSPAGARSPGCRTSPSHS